MAKYFFISLAFWFAGVTVSAILTMLLVKDADLVTFGFASVLGVVGWLVTYILSIKKQELEDINKKIESKADKTALSFLNEKLERFEDTQTEIHATITNIYNLLINNNK